LRVGLLRAQRLRLAVKLGIDPVPELRGLQAVPGAQVMPPLHPGITGVVIVFDDSGEYLDAQFVAPRIQVVDLGKAVLESAVDIEVA